MNRRMACSLTAMLAAGIWPQTALAAPAPVWIGVLASCSGPTADAGLALRQGVRLAVAELNWKGGLAERPIALLEVDDHGDPDRGADEARKLAAKGGVDFVVGITSNAVAYRALPPLQEAGIPVLIAGASDAALTKLFGPPLHPVNQIFRVAASDLAQADLIVRETVDRRHYRRIAILAESSPFGSSGRDMLRERLRRRLLAPPYRGTPDSAGGWVKAGPGAMQAPFIAQFQSGQTDMTDLLQQVRAAKVDAIVVWGQAAETAAIILARVRMGWEVPVVGVSTLASTPFLKMTARHGQAVRMPTTFVAEPVNPRRLEFLAALHRADSQMALGDVAVAAQGYDAMLLLAAAVRQAGSADRTSVRAALEHLQAAVFGVIATYRSPFSPDDHEAIASEMVATGEVQGDRIGYAYRDEVRSIIGGRRSAGTVPP